LLIHFGVNSCKVFRFSGFASDPWTTMLKSALDPRYGLALRAPHSCPPHRAYSLTCRRPCFICLDNIHCAAGVSQSTICHHSSPLTVVDSEGSRACSDRYHPPHVLGDGLTSSLTLLLNVTTGCVMVTPSIVNLFKHVTHSTQNIQNDFYQWLSDSFRVHQIRFRLGIRPVCRPIKSY